MPPEVEQRNGSEPIYNVAPTSDLDIVMSRDGETIVEPVQWGLLLHWAKDNKRPIINARGETAAEKPSFSAAFQYSRCPVPATGH